MTGVEFCTCRIKMSSRRNIASKIMTSFTRENEFCGHYISLLPVQGLLLQYQMHFTGDIYDTI